MRRQSLRSSEGQGTFRGSGALRTLEQLRCALGPAIDAKSLGTGSSLHGVLVTSNVPVQRRCADLPALALYPSPESSPGFVDTRFIAPAVQTSQGTRSPTRNEVYRGCRWVNSSSKQLGLPGHR